MASDPLGRHERRDRDRQDGDLGPKASSRRQLFQHPPQRKLGQPPGDKKVTEAELSPAFKSFVLANDSPVFNVLNHH